MGYKYIEHKRNISNEEIIDDIKGVSEKFDKPILTIKQYEHFGKFSYATIIRHFGSWGIALTKADLKPTKIQMQSLNIDLIELKRDILSLFDINGYITRDIYRRQGKYPLKSVLKLFNNSFEEVLLFCSIKPKCGSKKITNQNLFDEIRKLWIKLGRQPTTNDIKGGSCVYSLNTYCRRFGSWNMALKEFVRNENNFNAKEKRFNEECKIDEINDGYKHSTKRDINLRLRWNVMKRDGFKCCKCGRSPATTPGLELHIDHIKPWAKGGETVMENLQTLCSDCNLGKSDLE